MNVSMVIMTRDEVRAKSSRKRRASVTTLSSKARRHCYDLPQLVNFTMDDEEAANVYVSGLPASVTPDILRAAFIPFGELVDVSIPARQEGQLRFGFVLFEEAEDAEAAIDNMNQNIIHNARIRVRRAHRRSVVVPGRAVWHAADDKREVEASESRQADAND